MSKHLRITTTTRLSQLDELRSAWEQLFESDPDASPFLSYAWLRCWFEQFGHGDPRVELVYERTRLVAALWLHCTRQLGLRRWQLAGEAFAGGDYLDLLAEPSCRIAAATALARRWCQSRTWDILDFDGLVSSSPLIPALCAEAKRNKLAVQVKPSQICPRIARCDVATFERTPDIVFKRIVSKSERQESKKVALARERFTATPGHVPSVWLNDLTAWSIGAWRSRGGASCFESERLRRFYASLTNEAASAGLVEMHRLLADSSPVAIVYGLRRGHDFYFLQSGISPRGLQHKAGNILLNSVIRDTLADGGGFFFLRGDEVYKYRWGATDTTTSRLLVYQNALLFRARCALLAARAHLRKARGVVNGARTLGLTGSLRAAVAFLVTTVYRVNKYRLLQYCGEAAVVSTEYLSKRGHKHIHCKPLDESDLHQLRFVFGRSVENECRERSTETRGYCAYYGGEVAACAFVSSGDRCRTTDGIDLEFTDGLGVPVVHAFRLASGRDAEVAHKLLAYIVSQESQHARVLRFIQEEPGTSSAASIRLGFQSMGALRRRRLCGLPLSMGVQSVNARLPLRLAYPARTKDA